MNPWPALILLSPLAAVQEPARGRAGAGTPRPRSFPHRIWAACDFEARSYAWFGPATRENVPSYPGNATALSARPGPYGTWSARMTGMNPVPGPRMGTENFLYCRYFLEGGTAATFQHYSLSANDNNHVRVSGLAEGRWSEVTLNFSRRARRNDGTPGVPFRRGERMDDFKVFVGKPGDGRDWEILLDDVIFFAQEPSLPPEPEPFPRRVIYLAAFDTGLGPEVRDKYWHGEFDLVRRDVPEGTWWGCARAVPRRDGKGKRIRLEIKPPRPVGARTKLRFRYHLTGASAMQVQVFDATDGDNRHVRVTGAKRGTWTTAYLDFTRDGKRNDGGDTPFAAGHVVDDIFFLVGKDAELLVDEVVLFDAGEPRE